MASKTSKKQKIAVLIPCYNEELTIRKVIRDFKKELPEADIYVYNNNSTDKSEQIALKAGAIVKRERQQGKGNVVRSMFRDIDADIYVMVDGDDTYPAEEVHRLIEKVVKEDADMVIGDRLSSTYYTENKRPFHNFGNDLVRNLVNFLFKSDIKDIMTGYRVFSRRFVKSMPVISDGFQIETEMTVFALIYHMNISEVTISYRDRPEGSFSKLNTYKDGYKVLIKLFDLFKDNRPLLLFGIVSAIIFVVTSILLMGGNRHYLLISVLYIFSFISLATGIILDSVKNAKMHILMSTINNEFFMKEKTNEKTGK